ncbi:hypothetical protein [Wolbachia endosymbiont of Ctenocephalides felis wCfeT]|uniref:hypothetical protein n=1 Tax=Wolbachia endosymbiont of Ctenocephalides felis wCfeT TaxID=2732593 RepID=UPI0014481E7B|nr:hypothetical protein [Wolbachia endosymbiont of Ctenocephalides felis wCfeT]
MLKQSSPTDQTGVKEVAQAKQETHPLVKEKDEIIKEFTDLLRQIERVTDQQKDGMVGKGEEILERANDSVFNKQKVPLRSRLMNLASNVMIFFKNYIANSIVNFFTGKKEDLSKETKQKNPKIEQLEKKYKQLHEKDKLLSKKIKQESLDGKRSSEIARRDFKIWELARDCKVFIHANRDAILQEFPRRTHGTIVGTRLMQSKTELSGATSAQVTSGSIKSDEPPQPKPRTTLSPTTGGSKKPDEPPQPEPRTESFPPIAGDSQKPNQTPPQPKPRTMPLGAKTMDSFTQTELTSQRSKTFFGSRMKFQQLPPRTKLSETIPTQVAPGPVEITLEDSVEPGDSIRPDSTPQPKPRTTSLPTTSGSKKSDDKPQSQERS